MKDNLDRYFKKAQVVNFDIIHHECRGDKLQGTYKGYRMIEKSNLKDYPKEESKTVLSAAESKETIYGLLNVSMT